MTGFIIKKKIYEVIWIKLQNGGEMIGIIKEIKNQNNCIELIFQVIQQLELPDDLLLYKKLNQFLNKKIGLINIDGDYHIREIRVKEKNLKNTSSKNTIHEKSARMSKCSFEDRHRLVASEVDDFLDRWKQDKKTKAVIKSKKR